MIPTRVTLTVAQDELPDKEFVFDEPAECIIGRAADCDIQIPTDGEHGDVSRHHCVVEIHPPHAQVRDLGSLNGTFVNGRLVGRRPPNEPTEASGHAPQATAGVPPPAPPPAGSTRRAICCCAWHLTAHSCRSPTIPIR